MQPARIPAAVLALLVLVAWPSQASPPAFLVKDLGTWPSSALSGWNAENAVFGGFAFFQSCPGTTGCEPWRTDGTAAGTALLKDVEPGAGGSNPYAYVEMNGALYFAAGYGADLALWKTDGTEAGTVLVKDFGTGSVPDATELVAVSGTLFLAAHDASNGRELWKSDGTPEGTLLVKDIRVGSAGSDPKWLTQHGGLLFFAANDSGNGEELWKSDGTAAGTQLVKNIRSGSVGADPSELASVNGALIFSADDGVSGREPWRSDGTSAGTTLVKDVAAGGLASEPFEFTAFGGWLYFSAQEFGVRVLWKSDGTPGGTSRVYLADEPQEVWEILAVGGALFFGAYDAAHGSELWKTDGTESGTVRVRDIAPGEWDSGSPHGLTDVGGTLFFAATDPTAGSELWKSDGTEVGTVRVRDLTPGPEDSNPSGLTSVNGALFFSASRPGEPDVLWKSDGSEAGTQRVIEDWPNGGGSHPFFLFDVEGSLFLTAWAAVTGGAVPWISDGSETSTLPLSSGGMSVWTNERERFAVTQGGRMFFSASDAEAGLELWKSDGTLAGTQRVKDVWPGVDGSGPDAIAALGENVLFTAATDVSNVGQLWRSDGTEAGTQQVLVDGSPVSFAESFARMNGALYFAARQPGSGFELWRSDGTDAGTVLVKDLLPGSLGSRPALLTPVGDTLFFVTVHDGSLWKSDGTTAGTVLVKSFGLEPQGINNRAPIELEDVNGTLFFSLSDTPNDPDLWRSDGTPGGTLLVKAIPNAGVGLNLYALTAVGDTLFFLTDDLVHGFELWKSDGTEAGTQLVKDVRPGIESSMPYSPWSLADVNGTLFFAANDGIHGEEIWRSDGTEAGTQLHADVVAGSGGSSPQELTASGPLLYFSAYDDPVGRELFAVPATPLPAVIEISGIATGGSFEITTQTGVSVSIATDPGQSAQSVAANLAAAIGADATAQAQGISARVVGGSVILVGTDAPNVSSWTDDVGLGGEPPAVSAGGIQVVLALALALLGVAWLRRHRMPLAT